MENQFFSQSVDQAQDHQPFEITSDSTAEWAMRKIAEARNDTLKWQQHFDEQLEKIRKSNEETEAFFTSCLARYFETVPHKVTKTQSKYVLPCGEMVLKHQQPEFVRDDSVLAPYLLENGMECFVKQKPSTDWAELKKHCVLMEDGSVVENNTGLVLAGVTAENRPDKFEVKINGSQV